MPDILPVAIAISVVLLLAVYASVTVVRQDEAIVVFRLGMTSAAAVRGPGVQLVLPVIDRAVRVSMRETLTETMVHGTSKDDRALTADVTIRWRVIDPLKRLMTLDSPELAIGDVAGRALKLVEADEGVTYPGRVAAAMEAQLQEEGTRWGLTIAEVNVRRVVHAGEPA